MNVYQRAVPKEGAAGRLWCVGRLNNNINNDLANMSEDLKELFESFSVAERIR